MKSRRSDTPVVKPVKKNTGERERLRERERERERERVSHLCSVL